MYEHRRHALLSGRLFARRLVRHLAAAVAVVVVSIGIGMAGYMRYEHLGWRDAFLNAAMLLGGEGPVNTPRTPDGKVFAGFYALYSGLIFVAVAAIALAPVVHRLLHRFHWSAGSREE